MASDCQGLGQVQSTPRLRARPRDSEAKTLLTVAPAGMRGLKTRYQGHQIQQRAIASKNSSTLAAQGLGTDLSMPGTEWRSV